jgi:hypothetical protein
MHRLSLLAVVAFVVPVSPALAAESRTALSGPLTKLAQRDVRTAPRAERARLLSLPPSGPGSLVQSGGDVVVDVRAGTTSAAQVERLRDAGARIVHVAADLRTITVAVAPAELTALAAVPGVENVSPELMPETSATGAAPTCQGSIVSEADGQLRAAPAREEFGVTGDGVKVGVLSDSYDANASDARNAADGVASGDLTGVGNPCGQTAPVDVLAEGPPEGTDEGRGMLELVHDVAPGAGLAFASAVPETAFPARVAALREAGADVLVDDVGFFDEPFFQQGPADAAIEAARGAGSAYFTAAGNFNVMAGGQNRSSWEAPGWRSTTCPGGLPDGYTGCMNFAAATGTPNDRLAIGVAPGARLRLGFQWAEPWFGVDSDLDVFLASGSTIVAASVLQNNGSNGTQKPFEFMSWVNTGGSQANVSLIIAKYGSTPDPGRMKFILGGGAAVIGTTAPEDRYGPTIFGHNGAPGAMSVAAVPFSDASQVETFSSRGPVTHYFGPVSGDVPADALSAPQTLAKPDIAATDGTFTSFFPANGASRFFGTSAAAPHAAAVAALQMEAEPEATVDEVYDIQRATARPVGTFGADARGAGLLDAYAALDRITQGPPIPRTNAATGVSSAAATLPGSVNPHRLATTARFEYATGGGAPMSTPNQPIGSGSTNVDVSAAVTGLLPNATYTYRVVAANSAGTSRGEDRTFTTASVAPLAQTGAAEAITARGASLAGSANPQGTATTARFEYGTTTDYGAETGARAVGSGRSAVDVTAELVGLQPATTYHYRLVTTNSAGTTHGADQTFTTASAPPTAATGAASAITRTSATIAGTADPRGTGASAHFEYGPTTGYGNQTETQDIGSGRALVDLNATLSNLQPSTTYHYRVVATNSAGVTRGEDRTFTTAKPPTVSAPQPVRQIATPPAAPPSRAQQIVALTLSGRTLQITGAGDLTRAAIKIRKGKRTLAGKRAHLRSGAAKVRLRWTDVRNGRSLTVSLGGSTIRIDLQPRRVRLAVGGGFTRATVQVRRRAKTLADGVLQPPSRAVTLRLTHPRKPRSDSVVVVLQLG